jgi:hypothetical protein
MTDKQFASKRGKPHPRTPEWNAKLGAAISIALKGKPKSPEHCAKLSAIRREWWAKKKAITYTPPPAFSYEDFVALRFERVT